MANFNINIAPGSGSITPNVPETGTAGETLYPGEICYFNSDGKWYKTNASDAIKSSTEIRLVVEAAIADGPVNLIRYGVFEVTDTLVRGTKYYLSIISGKITDIEPSGSNYVRYIGAAFNTNILMFNPDQIYIKGDGTEVNGVEVNVKNLSFLDLTDTSTSYTGKSKKGLIVNNTETGLDFYTPYFLYEQSTPSATWTITHTLNKYPSVTVIDSAGTEVVGAVSYQDINNLTIIFNAAFSGMATLN